MVLLIVGCCSQKPLATLRAATPEGRRCWRNSLAHPLLWVIRVSEDEQILQSRSGRNLRKGRSEPSVSPVCVREGLSGQHPHLDSSLGQSFPWAVTLVWTCPVLLWGQGRDWPAGSGFSLWLCLFFPIPYFNLFPCEQMPIELSIFAQKSSILVEPTAKHSVRVKGNLVHLQQQHERHDPCATAVFICDGKTPCLTSTLKTTNDLDRVNRTKWI